MNDGIGVLTGKSLRLEGNDGVEEIILQDDTSSQNSLFRLQDDSQQSLSSSAKSADSAASGSEDSQMTSFPVGFLGTEGLGEIRSIQEIDGVEDDHELKLALGHIDTQLGLENGAQEMDDDSDSSDSSNDEDDDDVMIVSETRPEDATKMPRPAIPSNFSRSRTIGMPSVRSYMRVSKKKKKKKYKFKDVSASSFVRREGDPEENPEDLTYTVDNSRFTCKLCGAFFLGRRSLALHMQSYHNLSINKKFTTSGNEVRSLLTHPAAATAKSNELGFICKICDPPSVYSSQRGLLQHTRKVHPQATLNPQGAAPKKPPLNAFTVDAGDGGPAKIRFRCWHCSASFPTLSARMSHLQQEHTINGAKPLDEFPCEVCGFKTQNLVAYGNHTQIHDVSGLGLASYNNEIQEFSKETGEFKPMTKEKKEEMRKVVVLPEKKPVQPPKPVEEEEEGPRLPSSYKCPECGAQFQQAQEMKVHCRMLHPNCKIFMCRFCCKLEKDQESLEDHESSHFPGYQPPKLNATKQNTPQGTSKTQGGTPSNAGGQVAPLQPQNTPAVSSNQMVSRPPQSSNAQSTVQGGQNTQNNMHNASNNMYHHGNHPGQQLQQHPGTPQQQHPGAQQQQQPGAPKFPYLQNAYGMQSMSPGMSGMQRMAGMSPYHPGMSQAPMNVHPAFPQNSQNMYPMGGPMGYYGNSFNPMGTYGMHGNNAMGYNVGAFGGSPSKYPPNMAPHLTQQSRNNLSQQMNYDASQSNQNYPYQQQQPQQQQQQSVNNSTTEMPVSSSYSTAITSSQSISQNMNSLQQQQNQEQILTENVSSRLQPDEVKPETDRQHSQEMEKIDNGAKGEDSSDAMDGSYECHLCDEVFKSKQHYDNHMDYEFLSQPTKVRGQKGPPYPCCECFKSKYDMPRLLKHVEEIHPKISFNTGMLCVICLKICDAKVFTMHTDMHRKDKMQCVFCKKLFVSRNAYEGHMTVELARMAADTVRKVLPPPQLPSPITTAANEIICPSCGMRFISKQSYNRHKCGNRRTPNSGGYFCRLCGMRFDRHKDLRRHRCEDSVFKCVTCGQENEPGHNCSTALYGCKSCNISFNTEAECMKHIATAHLNPAKANGTSSATSSEKQTTKSQQKSNQNTYSGSIDEDLISCVACKMTFATFQERSKHILTEHIGGKKKQPEPPPLNFLPASMFMNKMNT